MKVSGVLCYYSCNNKKKSGLKYDSDFQSNYSSNNFYADFRKNTGKPFQLCLNAYCVF